MLSFLNLVTKLRFWVVGEFSKDNAGIGNQFLILVVKSLQN